MVVGWDDNYSKDNFRDGVKPEKDGAWLIRNSWGDGTGSYYDQSYFWMSYETFSLSDTAWVFDFSANDGYDNNYQVDGGLKVAHQIGCRTGNCPIMECGKRTSDRHCLSTECILTILKPCGSHAVTY